MSQLKFSLKFWNSISIGGLRAPWAHPCSLHYAVQVNRPTVDLHDLGLAANQYSHLCISGELLATLYQIRQNKKFFVLSVCLNIINDSKRKCLLLINFDIKATNGAINCYRS